MTLGIDHCLVGVAAGACITRGVTTGWCKKSPSRETEAKLCERLKVKAISSVPTFVPWKGAFVRKISDGCYEWCEPVTCDGTGKNQVFKHVSFVSATDAPPGAAAKTAAQAVKSGLVKLFSPCLKRTGEGCFQETDFDSAEPIPKHVGVLWRDDGNGDPQRVGLFFRAGNDHIVTTSHGVFRNKTTDAHLGGLLDEDVWYVCSPAQDNDALEAGHARPKLFPIKFLGREGSGGGCCLTNRDFVCLRVAAAKPDGCFTSSSNLRSLSRASIAVVRPGLVTRCTEGEHFCVTRNPHTNRWVVRAGSLQPQVYPFKEWGYIQHNISTHPGASGSLVFAKVDNNLRYRGLHLGNVTDVKTGLPLGHNLAIGAALLRKLFGEIGLVDFGAFGNLKSVAEIAHLVVPNAVKRQAHRLGEAADKSSDDSHSYNEEAGDENTTDELVDAYSGFDDRGDFKANAGLTREEKKRVRNMEDAAILDEKYREHEPVSHEGFGSSSRGVAKADAKTSRNWYEMTFGGEALNARMDRLESMIVVQAEATDKLLTCLASKVTNPNLPPPEEAGAWKGPDASDHVGTAGVSKPDDIVPPDLVSERKARSLRKAAAISELCVNGQCFRPEYTDPAARKDLDGLFDSVNHGGNKGFRPPLSVLHVNHTEEGELSSDSFWHRTCRTHGGGNDLEYHETAQVRLDSQYTNRSAYERKIENDDPFVVSLVHNEQYIYDGVGVSRGITDEAILEAFAAFSEGEFAALERLAGAGLERVYDLCCQDLKQYTNDMLRRVKKLAPNAAAGWNKIGEFDRRDAVHKPAKEPTPEEVDAVGCVYGASIRAELEGYHIPVGTEAEMLASLQHDSERRARTQQSHFGNSSVMCGSFAAAFADLQSRIGVPDYSAIEDWHKLYIKALSELDMEKSGGASGFPIRGSLASKASVNSCIPGHIRKLVTQRMVLRYVAEYARTEVDWSGYGEANGGIVRWGRDYADLAARPTRNDLDGLCFALRDPEVLFVKPEPHSARKIREGRYRCIYVGSLVDILIQYILHKTFNGFVIASYQASDVGTSYALGLGHHPAGLEKLRRTIAHLASFTAEGFSKHAGWENWEDEYEYGPPGVSEADATGWDNCVLGYMQAFAAELRCRSIDAGARVHGCSGSLTPAYRALKYLIRATALLDGCHVAIAGSQLYVNSLVGVMASGHLSTSVDNTSMRLFTTLAAYYRWEGFVPGDLIATGDDLIMGDGDESRFRHICEVMLPRLGVYTKDGTARTNQTTVEYTSHRFTANQGPFHVPNHRELYSRRVKAMRVEYLNEAKTLCRFLSKVADDPNGYKVVRADVLDGVRQAMRNARPALLESLLEKLCIVPV